MERQPKAAFSPLDGLRAKPPTDDKLIGVRRKGEHGIGQAILRVDVGPLLEVEQAQLAGIFDAVGRILSDGSVRPEDFGERLPKIWAVRFRQLIDERADGAQQAVGHFLEGIKEPDANVAGVVAGEAHCQL